MKYDEWLQAHSELEAYITFQNAKRWKKDKDALIQEKHTILKNKIIQALQDKTKDQRPILMKEEAKPLFLGGKAAFAYHQQIYIKNKIHKMKKKQFDNFTQHVADLVLLLSGTIELPEGKFAEINYQKLEEDDFMPSLKLKMLKNKFIYYRWFIEKETGFIRSEKAQHTWFIEKMKGALMKFDSNDFFLEQIGIQDDLELLFEYEGFALSRPLKKLVMKYKKENSQNFIRSLINLVYQALKKFNFQEKNADNVLILVLFRYAFDKLYAFKLSPLNRNGFETKTLSKINPLSSYLSKCTFDQLKPPNEFCPKHELNAKVSEAFRNDEDYTDAILSLESMIFYTNPIDALKSVRDTLKNIEKAANAKHPCKYSLLPFEVTFGLFLCVASAAHIPELQIYSDFVDECVPESGLSTVFDFAHTKLKAATSHLKKIISLEQTQ